MRRKPRAATVNSQARILIGTDNPEDAARLQTMLTSIGHRVAGSCGAAAEITRLAEQGKGELAVMDVRLIQEDAGLADCAGIYENHGVPVVFLARPDDERLIARTAACKPSGYVIKPLQEQQLRLAVETGLRRRAEDRRQKFEFIASAAKDLMTLINRHHVYEAANAAYRSTVRGNQDIIGRSVWDVWGQDVYTRIIKPYLDRCFSGEEVQYEAWINFHKRGRGFFDVIYYPYRDESGQVTHAVVVSHDITARKLAEESLKASERRLNSIIETTPDIIYRLDPECRITFINNAVTRYGYTPEEMIGKKLMDFIHPEDRKRALNRLNERRTGNRRTKYLEIRLLSKKEQHVPVEINIRDLDPEPVILVDAEGLYSSETPSREHFLGTQGLARDITERKLAELQIQENLAEKEILLQEIHHRVKNNLQVISSLLSMAGRRITDAHSKEVFGDIQSKVQSMALIHSKLYSGDHFNRMHIPSFARDIFDQIASVESWHAIKPAVTFKMDDASLPVNLAIPVCLFINEALTNIFRHAFPGGREGSIEVEAVREGGMMRIRITDDGVGIGPDVNIEKPTSMGFKLMTGIADFQLRGKMEIERDQGTAVVLTFPLAP